MKLLSYIFGGLLFFTGCVDKGQSVNNGAFVNTIEPQGLSYDFDQIQRTGELIIVTMSGPDTYFDYQGQSMGLQYALVAHFAEKNGLRVRVELAHTVEEMVKILQAEEADIICYQLPDSIIQSRHLVSAGVCNDSTQKSWAVRENAPLLATVLNQWYSNGIVVTVEKAARVKIQNQRLVRKNVHAPYISKEKGIISSYDTHFKSAARMVGWDWRLIAAQCYQESGFDPKALSWAGAKGLMQIMPSTAQHLRLPEKLIYDPRENIAAAGRYLKELNVKFSDIENMQERIKFVLAAYNGGPGHVRDAMALARKYGHHEKLWAEVSPFILRLSESRYYRDPVVKNGYMIGTETYNYVISVWERWRYYGGVVSSLGNYKVMENSDFDVPVRRKNKYTKGTKIYRPDDPDFNELNAE